MIKGKNNLMRTILLFIYTGMCVCVCVCMVVCVCVCV